MLLRRETLEKIESGTVDLVFRRWRRPTVRSGGSLRTSAGVLEIKSVTKIGRDQLDESDAKRAGLEDLESLLRMLQRREDGEIYRVELGAIEPDPRVSLRSDDDIDESELKTISESLEGLDRRSRSGAWTREYLRLIAENPHVLAENLAISAGVDKPVFKRRVRQLKELGLTISHSPGYELSPRGREVVKRLRI